MDFQFFYDCPRELELDVHFARITRVIEEHHIERLIQSYYGLLSRAPTRLSPGVLPDGARAVPAAVP